MEKLVLYYLFYLAIMVMIVVVTILHQDKSKGQNYNYYFRVYPLLLSILPPFLIYLDTFSVRRVGFEILGIAFLACVFSIIILILSFIKNTKVLTWIYAPIYFLCFVIDMLKVFNTENFKYADEEYWSAVRVFFSFLLSFSLSYGLYYFLNKKKKEISLWALAVNTELFIWIILKMYFYMICHSCRHGI
jgi:hypothetical protein